MLGMHDAAMLLVNLIYTLARLQAVPTSSIRHLSRVEVTVDDLKHWGGQHPTINSVLGTLCYVTIRRTLAAMRSSSPADSFDESGKLTVCAPNRSASGQSLTCH